MPTPYEEISDIRASSGNVRTDANLALDSLMLGGIEAEDYATKVYVNQVRDYIINHCKGYTDEQIAIVLGAAKSYTDTVVRNIDYSAFATKADLAAAISNVINQCQQQIDATISNLNMSQYETKEAHNQDMANMNAYINRIYEELFQSVSSGKTKVAAAITDKGVQTAANATFDTMATNIREIQTGGGGEIYTYDATATSDKILEGYTAYAKGLKLVGTYKPKTVNVATGGSGSVVSETDANLIYGKIPTESRDIVSGYSNICIGDDGFFVIYDNNCIYVNKKPGSHADIVNGQYEVKFAYTFQELGISGSYVSMYLSPLKDGKYYKLAICNGNALYIYKVYCTAKLVDDTYVYIPIENEEYGNNYLLINKWVVSMSGITNYDGFYWSRENANKFCVAYRTHTDIGWGMYYINCIRQFYILEDSVSKASYERDPNIIVSSGGNTNRTGFNHDGVSTTSGALINNDKIFMYEQKDNSTYSVNLGILNNYMRTLRTVNLTSAQESIINKTEITNDGLHVIYPDGTIKMLSINYETGEVETISTEKTLGITGFDYIRLNSTNEYIIVHKNGESTLYSLDWTQQTIIKSEIWSLNYETTRLTQGNQALIVNINSNMKLVSFVDDYERILGIEYMGNTFVLQQKGIYTANQSDVVNGKTFFGYNGKPEVGTLGGE